jgi:hypothetical protein
LHIVCQFPGIDEVVDGDEIEPYTEFIKEEIFHNTIKDHNVNGNQGDKVNK